MAKKSNSIVVKPDACEDYATVMASADEDEFGCMSSSEYNDTYYFYLSKCKNH